MKSGNPAKKMGAALMSRRIDTFIEFVQFLRTTEPKYTFEIALFHTFLFLASTVLLIMDEYKLWAIAAGALWISLGIQTLRIRRVVKRKKRGIEELVMPSCLAYLQEQHAAAKSKKNQMRHAAENARLLTLLKEDIERHRIDKYDRKTT